MNTRLRAIAYAYRHYGEVLWTTRCGSNVVLTIGSWRRGVATIVRAEVFVPGTAYR